MSQITVVLIIIAAAVGYVVYSVVKSLKAKDSGHCGGCDSCDIKNEFLKELDKRRIKLGNISEIDLKTSLKSYRIQK